MAPAAEKTSLTQTLGQFVATTEFAAIPQPIVERAKLSTLHNIGLAMASRHAAKWSQRYATLYGKTPEASVFAAGLGKVSVPAAVFANAAVMHASLQDDVHIPSTTHPGVTSLVPALAIAELNGNAGADLLRAVIMGYEVTGRIGRGNDKLTSQRGFRASCLYGPFGAAAAVSCLLNLDGEGTASAIGLAGQQSSGMLQSFLDGTDEWQFQLGAAANTGIVSARLAQAGLTSAAYTLEGKAGFLRAFAGSDEHAPGIVTALGSNWIFDEITLKPYAVCGFQQTPVSAMSALSEAAGLNLEQIERIEVTLTSNEAHYPGIDNPGPFKTAVEAGLSSQFCMAQAFIHRRALVGDLEQPTREVLTLASKVTVRADSQLPPGTCLLKICSADREPLLKSVERPITHEPSWERTWMLLEKAFATAHLPSSTLERLAETVATLERAPSIAPLTQCFSTSIQY